MLLKVIQWQFHLDHFGQLKNSLLKKNLPGLWHFATARSETRLGGAACALDATLKGVPWLTEVVRAKSLLLSALEGRSREQREGMYVGKCSETERSSRRVGTKHGGGHMHAPGCGSLMQMRGRKLRLRCLSGYAVFGRTQAHPPPCAPVACVSSAGWQQCQ